MIGLVWLSTVIIWSVHFTVGFTDSSSIYTSDTTWWNKKHCSSISSSPYKLYQALGFPWHRKHPKSMCCGHWLIPRFTSNSMASGLEASLEKQGGPGLGGGRCWSQHQETWVRILRLCPKAFLPCKTKGWTKWSSSWNSLTQKIRNSFWGSHLSSGLWRDESTHPTPPRLLNVGLCLHGHRLHFHNCAIFSYLWFCNGTKT